MSIVQDIPKDIGPRVAVSSHLHWAPWRQPYLFSNWNLRGHASHGTYEAYPCKIGMRLPLRVRGVVDRDDGVFVNGVLEVPVECPYVQCLSLQWGLPPDSRNCACCLDQLGYEINSRELLTRDWWALSDPRYFLVIPFVGVFLGNHDVKVEEPPSEPVSPLPDLMGHELRQLGFIDQQLLELPQVVVIEDLHYLLQLLLEQLSVRLPHLKRTTFKVRYVQVVLLSIVWRADHQFLAIGDLFKQPWDLVDERQVVYLYLNGPHQADY